MPSSAIRTSHWSLVPYLAGSSNAWWWWQRRHRFERAVGPPFHHGMMCFAFGGSGVPAGEHAAPITQHQRCPQIQPVVAAHIQHRARPAQHGGQQVGVATQPAQVTGTERLTVTDQPGSGRVRHQLGVVDGDHDPWPVTTDLGCTASGAVIEDHRDQRIGPALLRGQPGRQRIPFLHSRAASRLGIGIQLGDPGFPVHHRQAAGDQDRTVPVTPEHQRPVPLRRLRLPLQPPLQGLVSLLRCDLRQHQRGGFRQPVAVQGARHMQQQRFRLGLLLVIQPVQSAEHRADRPGLADTDPARGRSRRHLGMGSQLLGLVQHAGGFPLRQATSYRQPRRGGCPGLLQRLLGGVGLRQQHSGHGGQP